MSLPSMAAALQMRVASWYSTPKGRNFIHVSSEAWARSSTIDEEIDRDVLAQALTSSSEAILDNARNAPTYAISAEIGEQLSKAAPLIPPYPLHIEDIPTQRGFVVFEDPLVVLDGNDQAIVTKALAWSPWKASDANSAGVMFMLYTDPHDPRDMMYGRFVESQIATVIGHTPLFMWGGAVSYGDTAVMENGKSNDVTRLFFAFLRFIQEPWIETTTESPGRQLARQKARSTGSSADVKVIRLRKRVSEHAKSDSHTPVEWSHQWVVEGHWRNQWYPSQGRHAPRWIRPHVKGPDDKPLVVKGRIFQVDR